MHYDRAQNMVLSDKFNYGSTQFFQELANLANKYFDYDAMTVETQLGAQRNLVLTISLKKVKPSRRA